MNTASGIRTKPCFEAQCPMCMDHRTFFLLESALGLSGEFLVKGVACEKCGYESITCDSKERERLIDASLIWRARIEGKISPDAAAGLLNELHSDLLAKVREEGKTWVCEGCGEKNGMSFLECWNCQRQRAVEP